MEKKRHYKNINGTKSEETKRVGFCTSPLHPGYLSKRLMEEHQCIEKECPRFIKYEKSPYWTRKRVLKERRVEGKKAKKEAEARINSILTMARELTKDFQDFAILGIQYNDDEMEIRYVSIPHVDMRPMTAAIREEFGRGITTIPVRSDDTFKRQLIKKHNPESLTPEEIYEEEPLDDYYRDEHNIIVEENAECDTLI